MFSGEVMTIVFLHNVDILKSFEFNIFLFEYYYLKYIEYIYVLKHLIDRYLTKARLALAPPPFVFLTFISY